MSLIFQKLFVLPLVFGLGEASAVPTAAVAVVVAANSTRISAHTN